jgi:hypothetical protein
MKNLIVSVVVFISFFSVLSGQSISTLHSIQTNGYRIPNNVLLTEEPTLFNGVSVGSGRFSFLALYASELALREETQNDLFLNASYGFKISGRIKISTGVGYITGDVGGEYDFFAFPVVGNVSITDSLFAGVVTDLNANIGGVYYKHRVVYDDAQRIFVGAGGNVNLYGFVATINSSVHLRTIKFSGAQSWGEVSLKLTYKKLPVFVSYVKSFNFTEGADSNYALTFGVAFTPYKK